MKKAEVYTSAFFFSGGKEMREGWDDISMYLYDGVAGKLVMNVLGPHPDKDAFYGNLLTLFAYTDTVSSGDRIQSVRGGFFDGEASIVMTYILLYGLTRKGGGYKMPAKMKKSVYAKHRYLRLNRPDIFLSYAKRHGRVLCHMLYADRLLDIDRGKAGCILILAKLYRLTGHHLYIRAIEKAWERMKSQIGDGKALESGGIRLSADILMALAAIPEEARIQDQAVYVKRLKDHIRKAVLEGFPICEKKDMWIRESGLVWCDVRVRIRLQLLLIMRTRMGTACWEDMMELLALLQASLQGQALKRLDGACSLCDGICGNRRMREIEKCTWGMTRPWNWDFSSEHMYMASVYLLYCALLC